MSDYLLVELQVRNRKKFGCWNYGTRINQIWNWVEFGVVEKEWMFSVCLFALQRRDRNRNYCWFCCRFFTSRRFFLYFQFCFLFFFCSHSSVFAQRLFPFWLRCLNLILSSEYTFVSVKAIFVFSPPFFECQVKIFTLFFDLLTTIYWTFSGGNYNR